MNVPHHHVNMGVEILQEVLSVPVTKVIHWIMIN